MGGGAVEYGRGDCIRLWRRTDRTKRAGRRLSVAAAQMRRVAGRGNECIARIVRLGGHVIAPLCASQSKDRARGRRSYKTLQATLSR